MANFNITIADDKVTRIQAAFGSFQGNAWVPATASQVLAAVKDYIRRKVEDYEALQAKDVKYNQLKGDIW